MRKFNTPHRQFSTITIYNISILDSKDHELVATGMHLFTWNWHYNDMLPVAETRKCFQLKSNNLNISNSDNIFVFTNNIDENWYWLLYVTYCDTLFFLI